MERPELLVPAGNLEKLRTAILYGADAAYVGVEGLSLRAKQAEFSIADLEQGIREAHQQKVKVYAALNIFAQNQDLNLVKEKVGVLSEIGIDGVILSDPGILRIVRKTKPELPVHLSTQANTTNSEAVRFWYEQGVKRIVLARELNLEQISEIAAEVPQVELEAFIHGAMCMAYSGRCFLSAYLTNRSSNRGECVHPCRWEYKVVERSRPDEVLILEEDERYTYLFSSKDLRMIQYLPQVLAAGVSSLKIEGRMKSVYYVAVVTRTYRWALETALKNPEAYECMPEWLAELDKVSNRGYTTGFYLGEQRINEVNLDWSYQQTYGLVGTVLQYLPQEHKILVGLRNQLIAGDEIELLLPDDTIALDSRQMTDEKGSPLAEGHNSYQVYFPVEREVPVGAVVRRRVSDLGLKKR